MATTAELQVAALINNMIALAGQSVALQRAIDVVSSQWTNLAAANKVNAFNTAASTTTGCSSSAGERHGGQTLRRDLPHAGPSLGGSLLARAAGGGPDQRRRSWGRLGPQGDCRLCRRRRADRRSHLD